MTDPAYQLPVDELLDLFVGCWQNPDLHARLVANPRGVLAKWGVLVPDGVEVVVHADSENVRNIVIPLPPDPLEIKPREATTAIAADCTASACRPCSCFKGRGEDL